MRQHARSSVDICAPGIIQAIAGVRHDASTKTKTPNWRRAPIRLSSIPEIRDPTPIGVFSQKCVDLKIVLPSMCGPSGESAKNHACNKDGYVGFGDDRIWDADHKTNKYTYYR